MPPAMAPWIRCRSFVVVVSIIRLALVFILFSFYLLYIKYYKGSVSSMFLYSCAYRCYP
jgi:hypothetical protein